MTWEYRIVLLTDDDADTVAAQLNAEGRDMWELVAVWRDRWIFKRPAIPAASSAFDWAAPVAFTR